MTESSCILRTKNDEPVFNYSFFDGKLFSSKTRNEENHDEQTTIIAPI